MSLINYAIDITRPRTKEAMLALGVHPEELVKKNLEDFAGRNVSKEVQQLRYNYYTRKLKEVIRQLTAYIREENLRKAKSSQEAPASPQAFLTQLSTYEETVDEIQELKHNLKTRIEKDWQGIQKLETIHQQVENRLTNSKQARDRVKSQLIERRQKHKIFEDIQKSNLARIQEETEKKILEYDKKNEKKTIKYRAQSIDNTLISTSRQTVYPLNDDSETELKIQQFEAKMLKSSKLHEQSLRSKRQASISTRRSPKFSSFTDTSLTDVLQLMKKQEKVQARRHSLLQIQKEYREKLRIKHENRRIVALERLKDDEIKEKNRTLAIENRMKASEDLLKEKHDKWIKELELKNELAKLRDEEALLNAERKRRILKYRREIVIEKQLVDKERIEAMIREKCNEVEKKRDIAIRKMIEKEKIREKAEIIRKATDVEMVKQVLAELENHKSCVEV